jgi:hypothetical protein
MYPFKLHSNDFLVICPKNKPFFVETLKAGKAVAEPPKIKIGKADLLSYLLTCPRPKARRLFCEFSSAIYMGETGFLRSTASPS